MFVRVGYRATLFSAKHGRFLADGAVHAARTLFQPTYLPPVTDVIEGSDAPLWRRTALTDGRHAWHVVDARGWPVRLVQPPDGVRLLRAASTEAWGVVTDSLDVPFVVRYAVKPARAR